MLLITPQIVGSKSARVLCTPGPLPPLNAHCQLGFTSPYERSNSTLRECCSVSQRGNVALVVTYIESWWLLLWSSILRLHHLLIDLDEAFNLRAWKPTRSSSLPTLETKPSHNILMHMLPESCHWSQHFRSGKRKKKTTNRQKMKIIVINTHVSIFAAQQRKHRYINCKACIKPQNLNPSAVNGFFCFVT